MEKQEEETQEDDMEFMTIDEIQEIYEQERLEREEKFVENNISRKQNICNTSRTKRRGALIPSFLSFGTEFSPYTSSLYTHCSESFFCGSFAAASSEKKTSIIIHSISRRGVTLSSSL
ncbi:MAG: hypothetical protein IMZ43_05985 [Thermoplasmata archaeon]|nr:hypothetical protein [Thermoplasmata archaeon]